MVYYRAGKDRDQWQRSKEETHRTEPWRASNVKLLLFSSYGVRTHHRVLLTREAYPNLEVHSFYWGSITWAWLTDSPCAGSQRPASSLQPLWLWPKASSLNQVIGLSGMASPRSKQNHSCRDYLLEAQGKVQTSFGQCYILYLLNSKLSWGVEWPNQGHMAQRKCLNY